MIRCYKSIEEMMHPWSAYDDDELFMTPDELKNAKRHRISTPKERDWKIDAKITALRDN